MQLSTIIECSCHGTALCLLNGYSSGFVTDHKGSARIPRDLREGVTCLLWDTDEWSIIVQIFTYIEPWNK